MKKDRTEEDLPLGFGMLLARNAEAMNRFRALPDEEKQTIIDTAAKMNSQKDMRAYVDQIIRGTFS